MKRWFMKILMCSMICSFLLTIAGCQDNNVQRTDRSMRRASSDSSQNTKAEININDIDWSVDSTLRYNKIVPGFRFTNKSNVPITSIEFETSLKNDVTSEKFISCLKAYKDQEITLSDVAMSACVYDRVEPGQTSADTYFCIGKSWFVVDAVETLDLVEPLSMIIEYEGTDGKKHKAHYDYPSSRMYLDPKN